jgi:FkbM family methyltransferase
MNQPVHQEFERWFRENPHEERRFVFSLDPSSVVFDAGAYDGEWSKTIYNRYRPKIYFFEPSPTFFQKACASLQGTGAMAYPIALGGSSKELILHEKLNASSSHRTVENSTPVAVKQVDVELFFRQENIQRVDLFKINIEGAEYELLERMIEADLTKRCHSILIQYHPWVDNHPQRKKFITDSLSRTHRRVFYYEYVWELWELINP